MKSILDKINIKKKIINLKFTVKVSLEPQLKVELEVRQYFYYFAWLWVIKIYYF